MGMEHQWIGICRVEPKYSEGNPFLVAFFPTTSPILIGQVSQPGLGGGEIGN